MKRIYSYLIIAVILLFACNHKSDSINEIQFKKLKQVCFDSPKNYSAIYASQIVSSDTTQLLACYYKTDSLWLYNPQTGDSLTGIPIPKLPSAKLFNFYIHNKDSIFYQYSASYKPGYNHDSTLLMANIHGEIKKVFSFIDSPVPSKERLLHEQRQFGISKKKYNSDEIKVITNYYFDNFRTTDLDGFKVIPVCRKA